MGAIGTMIGVNGGVGGTGVSGPQNAPIDKAVDLTDTNRANQAVFNSLQAQQNLVNAIDAQRGIVKQNVAYGETQNLLDQLNNARGVSKQENAATTLNNLKNQYASIAAGQGPNPALAALANATGANVQNQAALMAGQRGASANAGLMARQAAMQGANIQQQAIGQAAELQAQQQLAALSGLGGAAQGIANIGTTQLGAQQAQQQALAGQAAGMINNQMGVTNALNQSAQGLQSNFLGGINAQNSASVANTGNINNANANIAGAGMGSQGDLVGGVLNAMGSAAGQKKAEGGEITNYNGPRSSFGKSLIGMANGGLAESGGHVQAQKPSQKAEVAGDSYSNDKIPTILSEGEVVIPRSVMQSPDPVKAAADFVANVMSKKKPAPAMMASGGLTPDPQNDAALSLGITEENPTVDLSGVVKDAAPPVQEPVLLAQAEPQAPPVVAPEVAQPVQQQPTEQAPEAVAPPAPPRVSDELKNEDLAIQQDIDAGHIQPKTYADIFENKSTLGKISTIFGLILSGAGSGLTKQPNALLAMMDKEIQNDLEAQKQNAANKQSKSRLIMDRQMHIAKIEQMKKEGKINDLQEKALLQEMAIKQDAQNQILARRLALSSIRKQIDKYPVGSPQRMQAENAYATLNAEVTKGNMLLADKTDAQLVFNSLLSKNMPGSSGDNLVQTINAKVPEPMRNNAVKELGEKQQHDTFSNSMMQEYKKISKLGIKDQNIPGYLGGNKESYAAGIAKMAGAIQAKIPGVRSNQDAERIIAPMLPSATDSPDQAKKKVEKFQDWLNSYAPATPILSSYGITAPQTAIADEKEKQKSGPKQLANGNFQLPGRSGEYKKVQGGYVPASGKTEIGKK